MKTFLKNYRHLTALALVLFVAVSGVVLGILNASTAVFIIGLWQLAQMARSKRRRGIYYLSGFSAEQIDEFQEIIRSCQAEFPKFKGLSEKLTQIEKLYDELQGNVRKIRK